MKTPKNRPMTFRRWRSLALALVFVVGLSAIVAPAALAVDVTTWAQLEAALRAGGAGATINILNDIDGVTGASINIGGTVTIEGNGHKLTKLAGNTTSILKHAQNGTGGGAGKPALIVRNVVFEGNNTVSSYVWSGGAIAAGWYGSSLTVENCTFSNFTTSSERGGGAVFTQHDVNSTTIIRNSTFINNKCTGTGTADGNTAGGGGGALRLGGNYGSGTILVENCTFYGNSTTAGNGGALVVVSSNVGTTANIVNCTFVNNTAGGNGGAIGTYGAAMNVRARNTIATGNNAATGANTNGVTDVGGNLIGTANNGWLDTGAPKVNRVGVPTIALMNVADSPAIGKAISGTPATPANDARGEARGSAPDIGAYQFKAGLDDGDGPVLPDYEIVLNRAGTAYTFDAVREGYGAQAPASATVTNTGALATGALTVALSGANPSAFSLSAASLASIASGGNGSFTVAPVTGLAPATYSATVTAGNADVGYKSFTVSFTVTAAPTGDLPQDGDVIVIKSVQNNMYVRVAQPQATTTLKADVADYNTNFDACTFVVKYDAETDRYGLANSGYYVTMENGDYGAWAVRARGPQWLPGGWEALSFQLNDDNTFSFYRGTSNGFPISVSRNYAHVVTAAGAGFVVNDLRNTTYATAPAYPTTAPFKFNWEKVAEAEYGLETDVEDGLIDFGTQTVGYGALTPATVTATNTSNVYAGALGPIYVYVDGSPVATFGNPLLADGYMYFDESDSPFTVVRPDTFQMTTATEGNFQYYGFSGIANAAFGAFTIVPKADLAAGSYTATIKVVSTNIPDGNFDFDVTFIVEDDIVIPPVDKDALAAALADFALLDEDDWTAGSWADAAAAALAGQGVYDRGDALQGEVDDATAALLAAIGALVEKPPVVIVDKDALWDALMAFLSLDEDDYTADSWADAFAAAEAALDVYVDVNATQGEVDDATAAMLAATEALVEKPPVVIVDKDALAAALAQFAGLTESDWTAASWAVAAAKAAAGQLVYDDVNATQGEVDDATAALLAAIEALKAPTNDPYIALPPTQAMTIKLAVGASVKLDIDSNLDDLVYSCATNYVVVSADGTVTGIKGGMAIITITSDSYPSLKINVVVTVS